MTSRRTPLSGSGPGPEPDALERLGLTTVPYFRQLPPDVLTTVARQVAVRELDRGEVLFLEGEPNRSLFWLLEGRLHVVRTDLEGREHILHLVQPGQTLNDVTAFAGGLTPAGARAALPSRVGSLPAPQLEELLVNQPTLARSVIRLMAGRLRQLVERNTAISTEQVERRVAQALLEWLRPEGNSVADRARPAGAAPGDRGSGAPGNEVRCTQDELAQYVGSVRQVVARALQALEREGIVERGYAVVRVKDAQRLRARARGD